MNAADVLEIVRQAIWVAFSVSAPVVLAATAVGIVVALLQALTQVQEVTLTFVPKIVVVLLMLALTANFIGAQIGSFAVQVYALIEHDPR